MHLACHGIYDLQCLYCKFGRHNLDGIRLHMSDMHADKPMLVRARKYRLDVDVDKVCFSELLKLKIV